jgi:hypothetical protein
METGSRYILSIAGSLGAIGLAYFAGLVVGFPLWLIAPLVIAAVFFFCRWMLKGRQEEANESKFALGILIACIFILTNKAYYIASLNGPWDAWAIWNFHAAYLADGAHWKNMLLNTNSAHPDYPLALPSVIAFFNRLIQQQGNGLVAYAIHFLITLLIPVLIYTETYRKNIFVSGLCLLLFATNEFYIMQGTYQLADTMLAFFLLCALVCMRHTDDDKRVHAMAFAFIGLCMWTKNEGVIIAAVFGLFYIKEALSKKNITYTLAGLAIPVSIWAFHKLAYAPPNDMVEGQSANTVQLLLQPARYKLIWDSFVNNLTLYFRDVKYAVAIYILICSIRWKVPDKQLLLLLTILLAYMMVYVVSPHNLEWHLFTSQSRLMHQLMPAMMYVVAVKFSGAVGQGFQIRSFSIPKRPR